MQMNSEELPFVVIGCLGAMVVGGVQPAFAIIFAEILGVSIYIVVGLSFRKCTCVVLDLLT